MSESKQITETEQVELEQDLVDEFADMDIEMILPSTNNNKQIAPEPKPCIIKDEQLLGLYDEILDNCRKDRVEVDGVIVNFLDMVMNDGDASAASKEAIVNLLKIKSDTSDKMTKIADLMTRHTLKDKDTFPRYMASQNNTKIVVENNGKRELIKSVNKMAAMANKKGNSNDK